MITHSLRLVAIGLSLLGLVPSIASAQILTGSDLNIGGNYVGWNGTNAAIGDNHSMGGTTSLGVGYGHQNTVNNFGDSGGHLMAGYINFIGPQSGSCLTLGTNNFIQGEWLSGYDDPQYVEAASVLGRGLINKWSYSTIVGRYNNSALNYTLPLLFAVGSGTDSSHRSNALEVYGDGSIKMARQGDILMGEFGNPEP